ncbi:MAG: thioredoxin family protein [Bacteroidia bacterium]|nr:thioredoxin family protein [Bacteroidia bacterium]MDW8159217.1 thioredoxin family protein [Bacteroidia bacterium]
MAVLQSNDQEIKNIIQQHSKVLIKFYADWCGTCKLMAPKFNRIAEEQAYSDITFVDINAEQNPEIRKIVGVSNLPFFAAFKNGQLIEADFSSKEEYVRQLAEKLNQ